MRAHGLSNVETVSDSDSERKHGGKRTANELTDSESEGATFRANQQQHGRRTWFEIRASWRVLATSARKATPSPKNAPKQEIGASVGYVSRREVAEATKAKQDAL